MSDDQSQQSVTVTDNRTGKDYTLEITDNTLRAADFSQIRHAEDEPGLALYDPGFLNTASCRSSASRTGTIPSTLRPAPSRSSLLICMGAP